jgi:hypothetical protein
VQINAPVTGLVAPTNTSCAQFAQGTAPALGSIFYTVNGGKIGQNINPGVFFYYAFITAPAGTTSSNPFVATVTQSNNSTNNAALFQANNGHAFLCTATGGTASNFSVSNVGSGATYTITAPGTYIISIQYSTKSIAGTKAPQPANITYNFVTNGLASTKGTVNLVKQ